MPCIVRPMTSTVSSDDPVSNMVYRSTHGLACKQRDRVVGGHSEQAIVNVKVVVFCCMLSFQQMVTCSDNCTYRIQRCCKSRRFVFDDHDELHQASSGPRLLPDKQRLEIRPTKLRLTQRERSSNSLRVSSTAAPTQTQQHQKDQQ